MPSPITLPLSPAFGSNAPLSGALMRVFMTGTTTPATVYRDKNLTTPHPNAIVASTDGKFPAIYASAAVSYRFQVTTAAGAAISGYDFDPVAAPISSGDFFPSSIADLQALPSGTPLTFLNAGARSGHFQWVPGNQSASVSRDPQQGIYVAPATDTTGASGCWQRVWDAINGRPEWFGAVGFAPFEEWAVLSAEDKDARLKQAASNDTALAACRDLCAVTALGPFRYYTSSILKWNASDRTIRGVGSGYNGGTASILCLVGPAAAYSTVFQFGGDSYEAVARGILAHDFGVYRAGVIANGSTTGDAEDCVKGVLYWWATNSEMRRTRVLNSPIGYHVCLTASCSLIDCNYEPSASAASDIAIGYLFGGYTTYPTFIGSNGSLRAEGNTAYVFPSTVTYTAHTLLFGLPADTWMEKCEGSGGKKGIDITGMTKSSMKTYIARGDSGTKMTNAQSANDIDVLSCRMDGFTQAGFYFHDLNNSADIEVNTPYIAGPGQAIAVNQVDGQVTILGGRMIAINSGQGGLDANSVGVLTIRDTLIRDMTYPATIANCGGMHFDPMIFNLTLPAMNAAVFTNVSRSKIGASVRGAPSMFTYGLVFAGETCGYNEVSTTKVDYGAMMTVSPSQKARYNGGDARAGFGTNLLVGVTG